jgi:adenylate cyclase
VTLRLAREVEQDPLDLPALHGGVATGDAVARRGELYGSTPNLAARLCSLAEPGCILADAPTRDGSPALPWTSAGRRRPKGFERAIELYALT